ncbi:Heat shock protein DnaJ [Penicillium alfredii]|uniref:Heat shock protein DnaJ n=1 Tax=Penicillium alfredii TaxID=1506179 RepID=A0A9W9K316_9EURO|nr:Heat shock protein DnaJ [Penicillium alfredii]KAJ5091243.1 Heat shock protein DnaJ [Penicillium alfredii]
MVKADVRRDYYADLGVAPSVEAEDIKKQFRKLALKYHPDRNPGKEVEFIAKFQAIQAAHEILSDPQQRLKYDTDRLRAGYGKNYGPPRANTQRKAQPTSYTPTGPPKTPNSKPPFANRPNPSTNGPSAGAQRYASHARAGPQWQKPQDEAQTRADAFRGFQGMRNSNTGSWQNFDPRTGRAAPNPGATPRQNAPFGQSARPKSAFEYFRENYRTQKPSTPQSPKKRQGFAPGTAGGDEPMARNTSSYTSRSDRPTSHYFDAAPPPTAKKPAEPESTFVSPEFERASSRYAKAGGERTFFSSDEFGRSASVRTPSGSYRPNSRTNPPSPVPPQPDRHRSASPKDRRNRTYSASTSSSDSEDDEEESVRRRSKFKPKAVPKSRLRPHQKFSDFHRQDYSSPGTGEDPFTQSSSQESRPSSPPRQHYFSSRGSRKSYTFVDLTADSDDAKGHNSDSAAFPNGSSYRPDQQSSSHDPFRTGTAQHTARPQTTAFGRSHSNDLHKKFSAEDWRDHLDKFDFLGSSSAAKPPHQASPTPQNQGWTAAQNGPAQPSQPAASPDLNPFGAMPQQQKQPQQQQQPTPFAQAKFSADEWIQQLNNLQWANPKAASNSQSTKIPPSRSPKKQTRLGAKVRSAPQPASRHPSQPDRTADTESMDVDDLSTPPDYPIKFDETPQDVYRSMYPDINSHGAQDAHTPASKSQPPSQTESTAANAETRPPFFNLDNLRNSAPFTTTNSGGIDNLGDVEAELPFESQAKQQKTMKKDIRPRELKCPNPPKRPWAPRPAPVYPGSQQLTLSRDKWNWYVSAMGTYMHEWNAFNRRMLLHFNTRQEAIETGLAPGWVSAVGDSARLKINGDDDDDSALTADDENEDESLVPGSGKGGFSAYLRGIEEDIQVRKHWEVACEMHRECIFDLGRLREWIRNGGKVV